jgi:dynein heavy chain, axonemal
VINVHLRDIIEILVQKQVSTLENFNWQKQLKYYYNFSSQQIQIHQTNFSISYSYEYLGNGPRLVMTSLTDQCYLTMTNALYQKFGGAPSGPAGTGKTETIKDLSKAFAIQCLVFNCSSSMNFVIMRRFFNGLAQNGSWGCFDEFNRIEVEVLSVIAHFFQTI